MNESDTLPQSQSVSRRLFGLALPIMGLNVLNVLALAVDTAMLGRIDRAEAALTGLGFATQLAFLLMVAMWGLTVGTVAFVSRAHGAEDAARVNHILNQSTMLTLGLGLLVATVGNGVAAPLLTLLGAEGEAQTAGLAYLRTMLVGSVFTYINILYAAVLRGVGNTKLPFFVALGSNALNVVLNYGLILGHWGLPALGIQGAAIGTVLSQATAAFTLSILLNRGIVPHLSAPLKLHKIDVPLAKDLVRIGLPASLDILVLNASFLSIVGMLARVDQLAVAAHGIGLRIQALAFVPGLGVSQATSAMVGQALGGGDVAEAKRVLRASVLLTTGIMTVLAAVTFAAAPWIVAIFDIAQGTSLSEFSVTWIRLLGICMPAVGTYIAFAGLFQGAGETRTTLRINAWSTLVFQIPASAVLGFVLSMGAPGIWLAFPLGFVLKAALALRAYRQGTWAKVGKRV